MTFRAEKFLKRLFGRNRLDDACHRLDNLTQEEARMAEAETLMIAGRIHEGVNEVKESVAGVNIKLESAHTEAQAVNRKVSLINTGDVFFYSLTPECVLSLTRLGVTEAREEIQVVFKHVSDLNRS